jgi:acetolactate synthase I/II/III large subunit
MNGAESLIHTALKADIEVCFANPGTTELPLVCALDEAEGLRTVLCLFEGVCTGAADGYARMAEKPALTLLHLGPGFANGIAYLHDARRARSSIVNLIGEHATWHLGADAPLNSDIESLARPVSHWLRRNRSGEKLASDLTDAIAAASAHPGYISTLIVPHDCQLEQASGLTRLPTNTPPPRVEEEELTRAIELLQQNQPTALFLGGHALRQRGLQAAARIAAATGCKLICETFPARLERGPYLPNVERLPYFPEQALAALEPFNTIILAGAKSPVSFFGYPGLPSYFISEEQQQHVLAEPHEDAVAALEALAEAVNAPLEVINPPRPRPTKPSGQLTPETLCAAVAAVQPPNAIIMDEGNTSSGAYLLVSQGAPPHSYLTQPGGAIGLGLPCSTGAAIACSDRPVINIQADGSAMYTLQALWTQARESLNVTTIICNNHSYRILGLELKRAGVQEFGPVTQRMVSLTPPQIDWVQLAQGMGVPAVRVTTADELVIHLERALAEAGPHLIEAWL